MNKKIVAGFMMGFGIALAFLFSRFEIDFGRVTNAQRDGKLYNGEPFYNYICYRCVEGANTDDIIITLSYNDRYGDCVKRWDKIVFKNI